MKLKCGGCGAPIDPAYIFEVTTSEDAGEAPNISSAQRLLFVKNDNEASEIGDLLRAASVEFEIREDDDDGMGHTGLSIWVPGYQFGVAQTSIARPGVEG